MLTVSKDLVLSIWVQVLFISIGVFILMLMWIFAFLPLRRIAKKLNYAMTEQARMMAYIQGIDRRVMVNSRTSDRIETANEGVALDLKEARMRADQIDEHNFGEASDAAARSPRRNKKQQN